jgi:uncharacterized membrane protein YbhN (UPF0104 family)
VVLAPSGTQTDAPVTTDERAPQRSPPRDVRKRLTHVARAAATVVLLGVVVVAVGRSWEDVRATIGRISPLELVLCEALILLGLWLSAATWRAAMKELGSNLRLQSASKIYLLGQLGKYLPGSLWAVAAQTALARRAGVPASRGASAGMIAIGINVLTGLTLGTVFVPRLLPGGAWRGLVLVTTLTVAIVALSPPVLTRLVNGALRILKQPLLERGLSWGGMFSASGFSLASWLCYGLSVWGLAIAVGGNPWEMLPLCLAGVAVAMTVGVLVILAPSGIGVRDAVIVASLTPVLTSSDALAVALVARLLFTLADLVAALVVLPLRIEPRADSG